MERHFQRQSQKPKPNTDMGTYGAQNRKNSFFVSKDEDEDLQLKTLQILSPKFKGDISMNSFNEGNSVTTTQSPENVSDGEEESKYCENINSKMESMKITHQFKESQPLSNKGEPLSPMFKNQAKMAKMHPYRNLIFNPSCPKEVLEGHLKKVHSSLVYAVHHLKKPKDFDIESEFVCLGEPKIRNQKTLFLDLDETLIHSCSLQEDPQYVVDGNIFKEHSDFGFNVRPYCRDFLKIISKYYEVYIFTASSDAYANFIVDILDPKGEYIRGILYRNHCLQTKKGIYIKDLRIIKNRELKNMVIVDNNAHAFALNLENGIPILEWKDNKKDKELKYILHYLLELVGSEDVRTFNRKVLKLQELANSDSIKF